MVPKSSTSFSNSKIGNSFFAPSSIPGLLIISVLNSSFEEFPHDANSKETNERITKLYS